MFVFFVAFLCRSLKTYLAPLQPARKLLKAFPSKILRLAFAFLTRLGSSWDRRGMLWAPFGAVMGSLGLVRRPPGMSEGRQGYLRMPKVPGCMRAPECPGAPRSPREGPGMPKTVQE